MKKMMLLASFVYLILAAGCKKENTSNDDDPQDQDPAANPCRLVKSTRYNFNDNIYKYDAQKRLIRFESGNRVITFSYNGNVINIVGTNNGATSYTRTVELNEHGLATSVHTVSTSQGWYKETFVYDGPRLIKRSYSDQNATNTSVVTYEWQNGNLVKEIDSNDEILYEYDLSKPARPADYLHRRQFELGYRTISSKNRVKKITNYSGVYTIEHFENNDGNITAFSVNVPGNGDDYQIQNFYECD